MAGAQRAVPLLLLLLLLVLTAGDRTVASSSTTSTLSPSRSSAQAALATALMEPFVAVSSTRALFNDAAPAGTTPGWPVLSTRLVALVSIAPWPLRIRAIAPLPTSTTSTSSTSTSIDVLAMTASGEMVGLSAALDSVYPVDGLPLANSSTTQVLAIGGALPLLVWTEPERVAVFECSTTRSSSTLGCQRVGQASVPGLGAAAALALAPATTSTTISLVLGAASGLYNVSIDVGSTTPVTVAVTMLAAPLQGPVAAVAASPAFLAAAIPYAFAADPASPRRLGGKPAPRPASAVLLQDRSTGSWQHFWVGGLVDANVTALVFENATGAPRLWAGNAQAVTRFEATAQPSNAGWRWRAERLGGWPENPGAAAEYGLPIAKIRQMVTALPGSGLSSSQLLWLATSGGLVLATVEPSYASAVPPPALCRFRPTDRGGRAGGSGGAAAAAAAAAVAPGCFALFAGGRFLAALDSALNSSAVQSLAVGAPPAPASPSPALTASAAPAASVFVLTRDGVAAVRVAEGRTLEAKAAALQGTAARHQRHGLVVDIGLSSFGNTSGPPRLGCGESDGLWTALYAASQGFRYAVTGEAEAAEAAWGAFAGLELLNNVADNITGLIARTAGRQGEANCGQPRCTPDNINKCFVNSTAMPGWIFMSSLSSDSLTGHIFAYAVLHGLGARNAGERERAGRRLLDAMGYIVEHGLYYLDFNGQPTNWGVWAPAQLNDNPAWYEERGLNSVMILGFLLAAHNVSGGADPRFRSTVEALVLQHGYDLNTVNQRMEAADDVNFSDDELAYLSYWLVLRYLPPVGAAGWDAAVVARLHSSLGASLARSWAIARDEANPLYTAVTLLGQTVLGPACPELVAVSEVADAVWALQRWPEDLVDWPTIDNSLRLDVRLNQDARVNPSGQGVAQSVHVLPPDTQPPRKWNANPFLLGSAGSGTNEQAPGAFNLAYWMLRWESQSVQSESMGGPAQVRATLLTK